MACIQPDGAYQRERVDHLGSEPVRIEFDAFSLLVGELESGLSIDVVTLLNCEIRFKISRLPRLDSCLAIRTSPYGPVVPGAMHGRT